MKKILFVIVVLFTNAAIAQQFQKCVTTDVIREMNHAHPGYADRVKAAFDNAKLVSKNNSASRGVSDTVYRITTVFHVVYTKPEENLDDSIILAQLQTLNEDFRRLNPDTANTRSIFQPFASDAGIEFVLADTDPDGNPTNGINRVAGTPAPSFFGGFNFNDEVKYASSGGVNAWDSERYLNIWVCNLLGGIGILGYAYPPAAPLANWGVNNTNADSSKQGVVLHYSAAGPKNPAPIAAEADGGRSATHEVGHYLGLRHIWGDDQGNNPFTSTPRCSGDVGGDSDGIDDTPDATVASQQTCNVNANTCPDPNLVQDYPDQIENYMDYSDDACLNMFTKGQVDFMRTVIELYRPGIAIKVVNTPSGVKKLSITTMQLRVFPNPANDVLNVITSDVKEDATLQVFNAQGTLVYAQKVNGTSAKINLGSFSSGIYLAVINADNFKSTARFIKK